MREIRNQRREKGEKKNPWIDDTEVGKNKGKSVTKNIPFQGDRLVSMSLVSELWESKCLFKTERKKGRIRGKGRKIKETKCLVNVYSRKGWVGELAREIKERNPCHIPHSEIVSPRSFNISGMLAPQHPSPIRGQCPPYPGSNPPYCEPT